METLNRLMDQLKADMKKDFVGLQDFEDWRKRVETLEENHEKLKVESRERDDELEKKFSEEATTREKVDEELRALIKEAVLADTFDAEIENLKNLINSLGSTSGDAPKPIVASGASISTKELNEIRDALRRLKELEERLKGFDPANLPAPKGGNEGNAELETRLKEVEKKLEELTNAVATFVKDINPAFEAMQHRVQDTGDRLARLCADLIEKYEFDEVKE